MNKPTNRKRRRFLHISAGVFAAASCGVSLKSPINRAVAATAQRNTHRYTGVAMGAIVSLTLVHTNEHEAREIANAAFAEVHRLERLFSLYRNDSLLVALNNTGILKTPPADLLELFSQVTDVSRATQGTFDPTIQPHWQQRLSQTVIDKPYRWRDVSFSTDSVLFCRPGMALTLNGIAQGYISEKVAMLLRKRGLQGVLVDMGEVVALGRRENGTAWQIGLAERQTDIPDAQLSLTDTAVATSAPLTRNTDPVSAREHIIDPETGKPCKSEWRQMTVIHPSATIADGLSTGLLMHGTQTIADVMTHYPEAQLLAIDRKGKRFEFGPAPVSAASASRTTNEDTAQRHLTWAH